MSECQGQSASCSRFSSSSTRPWESRTHSSTASRWASAALCQGARSRKQWQISKGGVAVNGLVWEETFETTDAALPGQVYDIARIKAPTTARGRADGEAPGLAS